MLAAWTVMVHGAVVTAQQALDIASDFLGQVTSQHVSCSELNVVTTSARRAAGTVSTPLYHVVNASEGWVIAAGDDQMPAVLAYGTSGNISPDDLPPALDAILQGYTTTMDSEEITFTRIKPLLTTQWGEDSPFNALCPVIDADSTRAATGSVATAMAQLLYYHNWPYQMSATLPAYASTQLGITMPELDPEDFPHLYDLESYYTTDITTQPDSITLLVAQLMRHCGQAVMTDYGRQSSARTAAIVEVLPLYYKYSPALRYVQRPYYTAQQWLELIHDELAAARPVVYRATSRNDGGHAFIIDGMDTQGRVHINWGWHGNADGYFTLGGFNPQPIDSNTDLTTDGWNTGDAMVVGIEPLRTQTVTNTGQLSFYNMTVAQTTYTRGSATGEFNGVTVNGRFNNSTGWTGDYELGFALYDAQDQLVHEVMKATIQSLTPSHGAQRDWTLNMNNVTPGNYILRPVSRLKGSDTWLVCTGGDVNYATVVATFNNITITPQGNSGTGSYSVSSASLGGTLQATRASTITATVTNEGSRLRDYIYLLLDSDAVSVVPCDIEPGSTGNIVAHFTPATASDHLLQLALDEQGNNVIYSTTVTIIEPLESHLTIRLPRVSNTVPLRQINGGTMEVTSTITNNDSVPYSDDIVARLYRHNGVTAGTLHGIQSQHVDIAPGGSVVVKFAFPSLPADERFRVTLSYYSQGQLTGTMPTAYHYILGDYPTGDLNHSRVVDITDLNLLINIILGRSTAPYDDGLEDVNDDGIIDITDVNALINIILGKSTRVAE